jgi:FkbH-like protein
MKRSNIESIFSNDITGMLQNVVGDYLVDNNRTRDYLFLYEKIKELKEGSDRHDKVAILSSFTFDQVNAYLGVELYCSGISSEIYISGFNQYNQEILLNDSNLYKFSPSVVILALRIDEIFNDFLWLFENYSVEDLEVEREKIIDLLETYIVKIKENCKSILIIDNFTLSSVPLLGLHDSQMIDGKITWINQINISLVELVNRYTDTYISDLNKSMSDFGRDNAYDLNMWYYASIPYRQDFFRKLGSMYAKLIKSIYGRKKCLIVDLDNTIWGGVIGEDGVSGLNLGNSFPGNVYIDIQKIIKKMSMQGVILAINSKNNEKDAVKVFNTHSDMVLKLDDFATTRINWKLKSENIKEIAKELNIGLDSVVFIDDSQFEIELVRAEIPEVDSIQLDENPLKNIEILNNLNNFDALSISSEDLQKKRQYQTQYKRKELKKKSLTLCDYYHSLEMGVVIAACNDFSIKRIHQLINKTNQFNLTTRRYNESEIGIFCGSNQYRVYSINVSDKFGDNGITGAIIVNIVDNNWLIDTFLLSCRVLGRGIENAFLSFILKEARREGADNLVGEYVPSSKNAQVDSFYKNQNFSFSDGYWYLSSKSSINFPDWIMLIE